MANEIGTVRTIALAGDSAAVILGKLLTVDGEGSDLDADTVDGLHAVVFQLAAEYTAADVLAKLITVDGAGSDLDADTVDGLHAVVFQLAAEYTAEDVLAKLITVDGTGSGLDADRLDGLQGFQYVAQTEYNAADVLDKVKAVDGPGSGLDADTVDGAHAAEFATAGGLAGHEADTTGVHGIANTATLITETDYTAADIVDKLATIDAVDINSVPVHLNVSSFGGVPDVDLLEFKAQNLAPHILAKLLTVDGHGSDLDADTLDGLHGSAFRPFQDLSDHEASQTNVHGIAATADLITTAEYTAADVLSKLLTVDGPGSGLDADTVDGFEAALLSKVADLLAHAGDTSTHGIADTSALLDNATVFAGEVAATSAATELAALISHMTDTGIVSTTRNRAVLASSLSSASANFAATIASAESHATGIRSLNLAADDSTASGTGSANIATQGGTAAGARSVVAANLDGTADANYSGIFGGRNQLVEATNAVALGGNGIGQALDQNDTAYIDQLVIYGLPTADVGLAPGTIWQLNGDLKVVE